MTPHPLILPHADRGLDDQAAGLAREAARATALRFAAAAGATFEDLAQMPGHGERRETPDPRLAGLRVWQIKGFVPPLAFSRPTADGIESVRGRHGARDLDRILAQGQDGAGLDAAEEDARRHEPGAEGPFARGRRVALESRGASLAPRDKSTLATGPGRKRPP